MKLLNGYHQTILVTTTIIIIIALILKPNRGQPSRKQKPEREKETDEEKAERTQAHRERMAQDRAERERTRQKEEEALRRKQEAEEKVMQALKAAEDKARMKKLNADNRIKAACDNLDFLGEAVLLFDDPENHAIYSCCGASAKLIKRIVNYSFIYGVMKAMHGFAQALNGYFHYNVIDEKLAYMARNMLMHFSWRPEMPLELLVTVSKQLVEQLNIISQLKRGNNNTNYQPISFNKSLVLFSTEVFSKFQAEGTDVKTLLEIIKERLEVLKAMFDVAKQLKMKNIENYDNCGILHHAMTGCIITLGQALQDLKQKDPTRYAKVQACVKDHTFLLKKPSEDKTSNVYQYVRRIAGHYYTDEISSEEPLPDVGTVYYLFEILPPENLYQVAKESCDLLDELANLFQPESGLGTKMVQAGTFKVTAKPFIPKAMRATPQEPASAVPQGAEGKQEEQDDHQPHLLVFSLSTSASNNNNG